jgi:hypothetical protein
VNFFRTEHKPSRRWRMGRPLQRPALRLETLEERVVPSFASEIQDLGAVSTSFDFTGANTLVIPALRSEAGSGVSVPAGGTIIVEVGISLIQDDSNPPNSVAVSVTDDAGNVYNKDVDSQPQPGGGPGVLIFSAHNIKALAPGQAITVHLDGGPRLEAASASVFNGLFLGPIVDKASSGGGYAPNGTANVTTGISGSAQQDDLVISGFAATSGSAPAIFAAGSGLQSLPGTTVSAQIATFEAPSSLSLNAEFGNVTAPRFLETDATYTGTAGQNVEWEFASVAYLAVPQTITSVSPLWVTAGSSGFTLTVNGDHFASNSVVQWNGQTLATTFTNSSQLQAVVPTNLLAVEGPGDVTVFTPGSGTTNVKAFLVLPREKISAPLTGTATTVFDVTSDGALYRHDASGWTQIGGKGSIQGISTTEVQTGNITLFAVTTDHALFEYTASGGWHQIGASNTVEYASAGLDEKGSPDVWVLTGALSLTRYSDSGGWLPSPVGAPYTIANVHADQTGGVNVITADGRENFYGVPRPLGPFPLPAVTGNTVVPAPVPAWGKSGDPPYSTLDAGVVDHTSLFTSGLTLSPPDDLSGWVLYTPDDVSFDSKSAGTGVVSIRVDLHQGYWLTTGGELFELDTNALPGSSLNAPGTAVDYTGASQNQLYAAMADGSVWQHDNTTGWIQLAPKGFPAGT